MIGCTELTPRIKDATFKIKLHEIKKKELPEINDDFAKDASEVGAGYVIFTMIQVSKHLIAPNSTFNKITGYKDGEACSSLDLVEKLYNALSIKAKRVYIKVAIEQKINERENKIKKEIEECEYSYTIPNNKISKGNENIDDLLKDNYSNSSTYREALNYRLEKEKLTEFIRKCKYLAIIKLSRLQR